jgi:hypothetical protein
MATGHGELLAIVSSALCRPADVSFPPNEKVATKNANVALDAIPDRWAKVDGEWVRLVAGASVWNCSSRCWQEGGPHDETCTPKVFFRVED